MTVPAGGGNPAIDGRPRLVLTRNPHSCAAANETLWRRAEAALSRGGSIGGRLETRGDGSDVDRLVDLAAAERPQVVVAAGGDGTVIDTVAALLRLDPSMRPALAFLPLGTGNNVARSFGLSSVRHHAEAAIDLAVEAALGSGRRCIDVGVVNGRAFAGAFSLAMDADILALRNRLRRAFGLSGKVTGYALYLTSCALNFLRPHAARATLVLDGVQTRERLYNLVVTNAPVYAGEFRFDGENDVADGRLDVKSVAGSLSYFRERYDGYTRHLRHGRGENVTPNSELRRAAEIRITLNRKVAAQIDGEELAPAAEFHLRVAPAAINVCVPR